jgi:hypothetical protein
VPLARSALTASEASTSPAAPPITESTTLSVSSWRTSRPLPAPNATRTATSRSRAAARASSRLATFAQAMSSTSPTAPLKTRSAGRTSPTRSSFIATTSDCSVAFVSGYCSASRFSTPASSAPACCTVTPGLSRPNTVRYSARRWPTVSMRAGAQRSTSRRKRKSRGATPITVNGLPLRVTSRPTMRGSPPKRRCQSPWLNTTTSSSPPTFSSSGRKARPSCGRTPSVGKKFAVTRSAVSCSGSPSPVRLKTALCRAAICAKEVAPAFQSTKSGSDVEVRPKSA